MLSIAPCRLGRLWCRGKQQPCPQPHETGCQHQPIRTLLQRHMLFELCHGSDELLRHRTYRDAVEIDAFALDEVEQQIKRSVEAVEMQLRRRGHPWRRLPIVPKRIRQTGLRRAWIDLTHRRS